MTTAWFEPWGGIAGDMTVAAFLDLGMPLGELRGALASLPVGGFEIAAEKVWRGPFVGTHFTVRVDEDQPHRHLEDIRRIVSGGRLPDRVVKRALAAFTLLAEAEGAVHGEDPEEIHFHEVGAVDAIVDVVGAAFGLEHFGVDRVLTTRVHLGTGEVTCAHGLIPVPGPAVLRLLANFPVQLADGAGETVTPTGAALLAAFAEPVAGDVTVVPVRTGYGAGTRDDDARPNVLRVTLCADEGPGAGGDEVVELSANLDDESPEVTAHAAARLMAEGALDAWLTPVVMKKGRPGVVLSVLARPADVARLEAVVFRETTTFGVRRERKSRTVLDRRHVEVETPWGTVRVKLGLRGDEVVTRSPEYEDCARVAAEKGVAVRDVYAGALRALDERGTS